jgi:hypothetical protein
MDELDDPMNAVRVSTTFGLGMKSASATAFSSARYLCVGKDAEYQRRCATPSRGYVRRSCTKLACTEILVKTHLGGQQDKRS